MTSFVKTTAAALGALTLMAMPAFADAKTEAYILKNANEVLQTLNDPSLNSASRTVKFNEYMQQFTDLDAVSNFVIGKYARRFTPAEIKAYRDAFHEYALTVYEVQLDAYRGEEIKIAGSVDRSAKDSIVNSLVKRVDGEEVDVRWRVLNRGGKYQVVDVALNIEGNLIWLGIEQRAQFLALLDRTNGSSDALIGKINEMTMKLKADQAAGREVAIQQYDASTD